MTIKVDFIAYHDLQAQAGYSIYEEMSKSFDCSWLIGPGQKPTGADAAVLLDHTVFHPALRKSTTGYKYLFHLSHDLGDVEIYKGEADRLKDFDIIFVPSSLHFNYAKKALGKETIILETGWAKYDHMDFPKKYHTVENKIENLPYKYTILYAPTFAGTYEWKYLFPLFKDLPCNIVVKNHIYVNKGQPFPEGQEDEYKAHLKSADEMEETLLRYNCSNMVVVPRDLNICALFQHIDILISDQSSVLLEFLPFGISIETGRYNSNKNNFDPQISLLSEEVIFLNKNKLCEMLSSIQKIEEFMSYNESKRIATSVIKYPNNSISVGQLTSHLIEKYFYEIKNKPGEVGSKKIGFSEILKDRFHSIVKQSVFPKEKIDSLCHKMENWRQYFTSEDAIKEEND